MKYLIPILLTLTIVAGIVTTWDHILPQTTQSNESTSLEANTASPEYCLKDVVTEAGGSYTFSEQEGGVYDYQIIATAHGIEVWEPCN
jgi:hypothetical protein